MPSFTLPLPQPHIGTDEAGKGDYFGYLVVAAVYVDEASMATLGRLGVHDSKKLTDKKVRELAPLIQQACPSEILHITPGKYNELYAQFGNLNHLLAWAHARVIENLVPRTGADTILSDQFGDVSLIQRALMAHGRTAKLLQCPRAEADPAVAAASVLARARFLEGMERLSEEVGVTLPKGATHVLPTARALAAKGGRPLLGRVAKLHFRTTNQAMGGR